VISSQSSVSVRQPSAVSFQQGTTGSRGVFTDD
jgi:hypothetical protein